MALSLHFLLYSRPPFHGFSRSCIAHLALGCRRTASDPASVLAAHCLRRRHSSAQTLRGLPVPPSSCMCLLHTDLVICKSILFFTLPSLDRWPDREQSGDTVVMDRGRSRLKSGEWARRSSWPEPGRDSSGRVGVRVWWPKGVVRRVMTSQARNPQSADQPQSPELEQAVSLPPYFPNLLHHTTPHTLLIMSSAAALLFSSDLANPSPQVVRDMFPSPHIHNSPLRSTP